MFSNSAKYAIRTILHLSKMEADSKSTVEELAKELDIPKPYLSKILQQLSRSNIISSLKGRGGGFYLDENNMNRRLIDVIVCIDGKNIFDQCIMGLTICDAQNPCILHTEYKTFKVNLEKKICDESLKSLITDLKKKNRI